jgi:hypothetical protein
LYFFLELLAIKLETVKDTMGIAGFQKRLCELVTEEVMAHCN